MGLEHKKMKGVPQAIDGNGDTGMVRTLSNWEYRRLLEESQRLVGRRLDKIYEISPALFRFDFGADSLVVRLGQYFYLTPSPPAAPPSASAFAMVLRKFLENSRLVSFGAFRSDRLYVLTFSNRHALLLEQFSAGNLFLLDGDGRIVRPYHFAPTSAKIYRVGTPFPWPDSPPLQHPPGEAEWGVLGKSAPLVPLSTAFSRWPMGKSYVREALSQAGLNENIPLIQVTDVQARRFLLILNKILREPAPVVYIRRAAGSRSDSALGETLAAIAHPEPTPADARRAAGSEPPSKRPAGSPVDVVPAKEARGADLCPAGAPVELSLAPLSAYRGPEFCARPFPSFCEAAEYFFTRLSARPPPSEGPAVLRLKKRLADQEAALLALENELDARGAQARWLEAHLEDAARRMLEPASNPPAPLGPGESYDEKQKTLKIRIG